MSADPHPLAHLPAEDAELAAELADLAASIHPAGGFVRQLNRHLDEQAARQAAPTRINLPARLNALRAGLLRLEVERPTARRAWAGLVSLVVLAAVGFMLYSAFQAMPAEQLEPTPTSTPFLPITGQNQHREAPPPYASAAAGLGFLSPPPQAQCDSWRKVLENELGVPVELDRNAVYTERYNYTFSNNLPNNSGRGCLLSAQGSAATFGGIRSLSRRLENLVTTRGYTFYGDFRFEGGFNNEGFEPDQYGKVEYFTDENRRLSVAVSGRPMEGAACPTGQPAGRCAYPPEMMAINLRVMIANDDVTPRINQLIKAFIQGMREGSSATGSLLASELRASLVGADAINRLLGIYDRTRFESFSYDIVSYYQRQVTVALYLDSSQRAPAEAGPSNYLVMHQEEGHWRISAISPASGRRSPRQVAPGLLTLPDPQTCSAVGDRLQALYPAATFDSSVGPFSDPGSAAPGVNGQGCNLVLQGSGADFGSIQAALDRVRPLLIQMGFANQNIFDATGGYPNPVISGDWYGKVQMLRQPVSPLAQTTARAQIAVSWRPKNADACLAGQPVAACSLKPENQVFTVRVSLASDQVSAQIERSLDELIRLWAGGSRYATIWLTPAMQQQVAARGGAANLIDGVDPQRVGDYSYSIQKFDGNRATLRLWMTRTVPGSQSSSVVAARSFELQRLGERWLVDRITPVMVSEAERLLSEGKITQAINAYTAVVLAYPPDLNTSLALGETLIYARRYAEAVAVAGDVLAQFPGDARALAFKGWALGWQGDLAEARALLEQAAALDQSDAKTRAYLAMTLIRQYDADPDPDLLKQAREYARSASENAPDSIETNHARAQVALRQGSYREAAGFIKQAIARNENLSLLHVELAEIYAAVPMVPQAMSELQRAVALDPDDWQALDELSRLYAGVDLLPRALEFAAEAVSKAPENNRLLAHLGEMQYRNQHYGEAALTLRLALFGGESIAGSQVAPLRVEGGPPTHYDFLFGMALAREGRCAEAAQVARDLRDSASGDPFSASATLQIEQICANAQSGASSPGG